MGSGRLQYLHNEIICRHGGWTVRYLPGYRGLSSPFAVCDPGGIVVACFHHRSWACDKAYEWAYRMELHGETYEIL